MRWMTKGGVAWPLIMLAAGLAGTARAALPIGQVVPMFSAQAALDGKPFSYSLEKALARGPVIVYFFPAAFTVGCSLEAHAFAEAVDQFAALGTTVIGVSTDDIDTLTRFSSQACQGKFPVASDDTEAIVKSFDAGLQTRPGYANRISYAIAPDGKVAATYQSLNPDQHVAKMLAAARELARERAR